MRENARPCYNCGAKVWNEVDRFGCGSSKCDRHAPLSATGHDECKCAPPGVWACAACGLTEERTR